MKEKEGDHSVKGIGEEKLLKKKWKIGERKSGIWREKMLET